MAVFSPGIASEPITSRGGWPGDSLDEEVQQQLGRGGVGSGLDGTEGSRSTDGLLGSVPIEGVPGDRPGVLVYRVDRPLRDEDRELVARAVAAIGEGLRSAQESMRLRREVEQARVQVAALDQANDVIVISEAEPIQSPGPRVIYVNQAFTKMTGYAAEEIIGKTPRILQGPDTSRETLDLIRETLARWKPIRAELQNYRKDGSKFWVELNIRPVADANGWYTHWISVQRDITERKKQEERQRQMAAEARRLAMAVSRTSNSVIITDVHGRIEWVNDAFARLCGYSHAEVIGRKPGELLQGPETDPATIAFMRQRMQDGEGFQVELLNYSRSGEKYWANLDVQPLRDDEGRLVNFVGIAVDLTERRRIESEVRELNVRLEQRLRRAAAHRRVDAAIALGRALEQTIDVLLDQVMGELNPSAAAVLTCANGDDRELTLLSCRGFRHPPERGSRIRHDGSLTGHVRVEEPTRVGGHWVDSEGFLSSQSVILSAKGRTLGALVCYQRAEFRADLDWLDLFEVLASQAAIAIDNASLVEELRGSNRELALAYDKTIEGWSRVMDLRDRETEGHSRRVAELAERLARRMGLPESRLIHLRRGALLHDIGKMGVPDAILMKPGKLDPHEWREMKRHPELAEEMLRPIEFLRPALDIPVFHHEKWDGTGYPRGLKEAEIPIEARIFAAVDIYDALTSDRPYRAAWPVGRVRQHLRDLSGSHLDPAVVDAFDRMLEEDDRENEQIGISRSNSSVAHP